MAPTPTLGSLTPTPDDADDAAESAEIDGAALDASTTASAIARPELLLRVTTMAPRWMVVVALLLSTVLAANSSGSSDTSSTAAPNVTASDLIGWFNCSAITFADQEESADSLLHTGSIFSSSSLPSYAKKGQCAQYQAPLCHAGVCEDAQGRTIDVFVKRVLARSSPETRPNVWFLQGGPGAASPTMEYGMRALYMQLDGLMNVYTMDHRGTGRSTPLNCVTAQATTSGSPLGADLDISEFAACAQELQTRYGDLTAFSITSAASDLSRFITTYQPGSKTFVYGVSYGSALVERLMHLGTKEIVGYILDGVSTTSGADAKDGMYMSNWDVNFGEVADHFLELISNFTFAATAALKFGSKSAAGALKDALATVEKDPKHKCAKEFANFLAAGGAAPPAKLSTAVRMLLGKLLMSSTTRVFVPVLIYRLERCNKNDQLVLAFFVKAVRKQLATVSEEDALMSTLEYYLIVFSEMWESPTPDLATMTARFTNAKITTGPIADLLPLYCAFTKDTSSACSALKALVTFQYTPHGALLNAVYRKSSWLADAAKPGFCAVDLLASYVNAGGNLARVDGACVASVDADMRNMDLNVAYAPLFGVASDMYDGELDGELVGELEGELDGDFSSTFLAPLVIAACVVAALAIVLGAFVYKRWAARKAAAAAGPDAAVGLESQSPSNSAAFAVAPPSVVASSARV
ncbi:hypothetical protein PybrP1_007416 [[Pythium] brassicae (nom. inval.)]|nr:hypothetical protein PybrP1_007416 [[Pythium] brassicae (nom. inval.)]